MPEERMEREELPAEFVEFLAAEQVVDPAGVDDLRSAWRAWATLYSPAAQEPSSGAFEAYFFDDSLPTPLVSWHFSGQIRHSQQVILDAVQGRASAPEPDPLHLVAPPGAGKTLIGALLAMERGHKTLALAPTSTIRHQWVRTAHWLSRGTWGEDAPELRGDTGGAPTVSEDPQSLGDFTALTYQMLSVVGVDNPFDDLARQRWIDELIEGGRGRADAKAWVEDLERTNRGSFRKGIRRRARRIRRDVLQEDPARLEEALHPNARELITRLAEEGVGTIILDECHHLLDHWALVVHCLVNRLRARGICPLLIGLTATLPSVEDGESYENYTRLLGEVDYELPTPAVVKEGNLAPYRSFAWFVTPQEAEVEFIRHHERRLSGLIEEVFTSESGHEFLIDVLQEGEGSQSQRLAQAFKSDPTIAEAASRMLHTTQPRHPLVRLFPAEVAHRQETESLLRLLARYALTVVLPDPGASGTWDRIKSVLVDFGYHLTDRGIRRGRDPIDQILATTPAKDEGVLDVLRLERASATRVRAVVVSDFAVHGHMHDRGSGTDPDAQRAGALRCHSILAAAEEIADMRPVLVTARHLRVPTRDAHALAAALGRILAEDVMPTVVEGTEHVSEISVRSGPARTLAAVSELMTRGDISLIVGTRGLLGEGWDCPAVNTLIDISAVATSTSTQQLRGRTLRLDPQWAHKVAHNWTITSVLDPAIDVDGGGDMDRLQRKLSTVWGLSLGDDEAVVKGEDHTISPAHWRALVRYGRKHAIGSLDQVNGVCRDEFPAREETYARWRIGEPYLGATSPLARVEPGRVRARPFSSGITFEAFFVLLLTMLVLGMVEAGRGMAGTGLLSSPGGMVLLAGVVIAMLLWRRDVRRFILSIKQFALPLSAYRGATRAIAETLAQRTGGAAFGRGNIHVEADRRESVVFGYTVTLSGGGDEQQKAVLDALTELFEPISSPRFVLEVGVSELQWRRPVSALSIAVMRLLRYRGRFFGLPRELGRRRQDAQFFAAKWEQYVGPCVLHEISTPEDMAILTLARKQFGGIDTRVRRRTVWA